jgi:hypothetical protein
VTIKKNSMPAEPSLNAIRPFSPLVVDIELKRESFRPQMGSNARRTTLGWSMHSTRRLSTDQKENAVGTGVMMM